MHPVEDKDLPTLPLDQPEFFADPMHFVEPARRQHPWLAKFSQGYVVHGYQAFKDLLFLDDKLQPGLGGIVEFYDAQGTEWARFMDEMLINATGERHKRLRASVAEAFTPRRANQARPLMQKVISDLLDEWVPKGSFDFADFASYFPVAVMCGVLGVSTDAIPQIRNAIEDHMAGLTMNKARWGATLSAYDVIWNYVDGIVLAREREGVRDVGALLDALIATKNAGGIDEVELRFMVMTFLIAGYDTSKNMLTMTIHQLMDKPELWERCARDKSYCEKVLDEALRHSSIATFYRMVAQDFEYDGFLFRKGALVVFSAPLTGRDPSAFENPMTFDPEKAHSNRHVAFGRGAHICIGQFLARNQLVEGLHLIAQRIENPRLAGEIVWRPFLGAWGLATLPIAFDRGARPALQ
jgi:cytochrome P450